MRINKASCKRLIGAYEDLSILDDRIKSLSREDLVIRSIELIKKDGEGRNFLKISDDNQVMIRKLLLADANHLRWLKTKEIADLGGDL